MRVHRDSGMGIGQCRSGGLIASRKVAAHGGPPHQRRPGRGAARRVRRDPRAGRRGGRLPRGIEAEAERRRSGRAAGERVDLPFVTIDPPGSRDLDQALHIARRDDGHRVSYAIADLGAFVAARRRARPRGPRPRGHRLRARRERAAAPAGPVGGRGQPAAGRVAPGGAVDDRPRRDRRADRDPRRPRRGPQRRPAHLRRRARGRRGAAARGRRAAPGARARPRRRAPRRPRPGDRRRGRRRGPCATASRSRPRTTTRRSRC